MELRTRDGWKRFITFRCFALLVMPDSRAWNEKVGQEGIFAIASQMSWWFMMRKAKRPQKVDQTEAILS